MCVCAKGKEIGGRFEKTSINTLQSNSGLG